MKALGNQIGVDGGTVGGTAPGAGNLISCNQTGIFAANQVQGNLIGTDVTGTKTSPSLGNITGINGANLIGGTTAAARNIISGNSVGVSDEGDLIEGNYIGTDISGTMWLANAQAGVQVLGA
jgi:titin